MGWHPEVIDIFRKAIRCPSLLAVKLCKVELANCVTILSSIFSIYFKVVSIDVYGLVLVFWSLGVADLADPDTDRLRLNEDEDFFLAVTRSMLGSL